MAADGNNVKPLDIAKLNPTPAVNMNTTATPQQQLSSNTVLPAHSAVYSTITSQNTVAPNVIVAAAVAAGANRSSPAPLQQVAVSLSSYDWSGNERTSQSRQHFANAPVGVSEEIRFVKLSM